MTKIHFKILFIFSFFFIFTNCKTNRIVNKEKQGKWIYKDTVNEVIYKSVGKYKKGIEQKTWRYYATKKLIKKEKYNNGICYVTNYYNSGKISSKGKTKMVITDGNVHWFYFDDWFFYTENGQLTTTKNYADGELISETKY